MRHPFTSLALSTGFLVWLSTCELPAQGKGLLDFLNFKRAPQATAEARTPSNKKHCISGQIVINAPQALVWQTIHDERASAPDLAYSKVISENENLSVVEQRWNVIPFLKQSSCTMSATDHPNDRIDFKLLQSDEFKVMEGSWILTPAADGNSILLELNTYIELRRFGSLSLVKMIGKRKIARRLAHIKELAEAVHPALQVDGKLL